MPVVPTAITGAWGHIGAIQVQGVATAAKVRSRRPIEAAQPSIVGRRRIEVAGVEEVVRISS